MKAACLKVDALLHSAMHVCRQCLPCVACGWHCHHQQSYACNSPPHNLQCLSWYLVKRPKELARRLPPQALGAQAQQDAQLGQAAAGQSQHHLGAWGGGWEGGEGGMQQKVQEFPGGCGKQDSPLSSPAAAAAKQGCCKALA